MLEEQNRLIGDSQAIEHEHIKKMDYLEACIRESLRLTAPVCTLRFSGVDRFSSPLPLHTKWAPAGWP